MNDKRLLIPLGAAVAALLPLKAQATLNTADTQKLPHDAVRTSPLAAPDDYNRVLRELTYVTQSEIHSLVLRQSSTGTLYAGHGSHRSHGSHASHGSHRSGY